MLHKTLRLHGLYASGKFDEYQGNVGLYGIVVECVKSLITQDYSHVPAEKQAEWYGPNIAFRPASK